MISGTAQLSDDRLLEVLHTGELPIDDFRHGDHLRLAWILLHRLTLPEALREVRKTIRDFGAHHKVEHAYNETVTIAWVLLISTHTEPTFGEFLSANEERLGIGLLHSFWTPELLKSDEAKRAWVEPDKRPLPVENPESNAAGRQPSFP